MLATVSSVWIARARRRAAEWLQIVQCLDRIFGVLHGQHVVVAAPRIDPVAWRDHRVRGERRDDVVDDLLLVRPQFAGLLAVDVRAAGRDSRCPAGSERRSRRASANLLAQSARRGVASSRLMPLTWTSIGAGSPGSRLHRPVRPTGSRRSVAAIPSAVASARGPCIRSCRSVSFFQADLDERGVRAGVGRVDRGEIRRRRRCWKRSSPVRRAARPARIDVFDLLARQFSVISMRVPEGAFTLMTNWPGSVRGK